MSCGQSTIHLKFWFWSLLPINTEQMTTLHFKFICRIMKNTLILISYITVLKFVTEEWALPHFFKNYYCVFWLLFVLCFGKLGLPYLGEFTAVTRTVLPNLTHAWQYFHVCKTWCGCQCLGFLMCVQILTHVTAQGLCTNTIKDLALKGDPGRKIPSHT